MLRTLCKRSVSTKRIRRCATSTRSTKGPQAIRDFARAMRSDVGNLPPLPGVFPDYSAPIVRNGTEGRELVLARWGMPSPFEALKGKNRDPGVTNIRNVASPRWRRWLGVESRCVVPFHHSRRTKRLQTAPARRCGLFDESRPLAFFAGLWTRWTSVRKVKEGETTNDLYGFLTTAPNAEVKAIHPKAMPVILTTPGEVDIWMRAPTKDALLSSGCCRTEVSRLSRVAIAPAMRRARSSNSRVDSQPFRHFAFVLRPSTRHRSFRTARIRLLTSTFVGRPTKARSPAAPSSSSACPVGSILPTARSRRGLAPIRSTHGEGQKTANQSRSLDHLRRPDVFLTAMAIAFF